MSQQATPDLQRLRLRLKLREVRAAIGMTQNEVATRLDWSLSKVIRIETGRIGISVVDLRALLDLYRVDDPDLVAQLIEFGRGGRTQSWSRFKGVLRPEYLQFLGYEAAASRHRQFEPVLIPGLLQTKDYARAIADYFPSPSADPSVVKRQLEAKALRQKRLDHEWATLHFILDEAVIRRWIGPELEDPSIMRDQLMRLKQLNRRPHITIQVIPFKRGLHEGMRGSFVLLTLDGIEGDLLYEETAKGSSITRDNSDRIRERAKAFEHLASIACQRHELDRFIDRVLREMRATS
jgi:transcriptional regulator with XRE-family HTH domain